MKLPSSILSQEVQGPENSSSPDLPRGCCKNSSCFQLPSLSPRDDRSLLSQNTFEKPSKQGRLPREVPASLLQRLPGVFQAESQLSPGLAGSA